MNVQHKMSNTLFFPKLNRREQYRLTRRQKYYQDYNQYRQEIREDCLGRCVYCDRHENHVGGHESMNLDHFRPKGISEFRHLINDPNNLVWSCRRCNGLKYDHWPAKGTNATVHDNHGFIDPFIEDRLEYFFVDDDGSLIPLKPPAHYILELLGLNYHFLRQQREIRLKSFILLNALDEEVAYLQSKVDLSTDDYRVLTLLRQTRLTHEHFLDFTLHM